MATTFVLDSNIPVDPNSNPNDPSHPSAITKKTIMLQKQANADTKYDIPVPDRIPPEHFSGTMLADMDSTLGSPTYFIIFSVCAALLCIGLAIQCKSFYFKLAYAVGALVLLHYAVGRMEK